MYFTPWDSEPLPILQVRQQSLVPAGKAGSSNSTLIFDLEIMEWNRQGSVQAVQKTSWKECSKAAECWETIRIRKPIISKLYYQLKTSVMKHIILSIVIALTALLVCHCWFFIHCCWNLDHEIKIFSQCIVAYTMYPGSCFYMTHLLENSNDFSNMVNCQMIQYISNRCWFWK